MVRSLEAARAWFVCWAVGLEDNQNPVKLKIKEDNQATIKVVNKGYSQKLRHVLRHHKVDIGSIHETLQDENIVLKYCKTDDQAADIFTKPSSVQEVMRSCWLC